MYDAAGTSTLLLVEQGTTSEAGLPVVEPMTNEHLRRTCKPR